VAVPVQVRLERSRARRNAQTIQSKRLTDAAVYVVEKMAHGFKRMGRASGAGFYVYDASPPMLWSGLRAFERRSRAIEPDLVRERLFHAAVAAALGHARADRNDAARILGPRIPADRDAALAFLREHGREGFVARARDLASRFGDRFLPPAAALEAD
jgi:3-hydroxyacyl-CoA dehydrogenase/enoyl-CoA hydratase/3-hydroxybutyryl-CoA epimerase